MLGCLRPERELNLKDVRIRESEVNFVSYVGNYERKAQRCGTACTLEHDVVKSGQVLIPGGPHSTVNLSSRDMARS